MTRCVWATPDPLLTEYHDKEWGVPVHDDTKLFEMLILEGVQAGLSWITVLKKRENYGVAFDHFNPKKIAQYDRRKIKQLLANSGIIRHRLKIEAAVWNAKAVLELQKEFGSFDRYVWQFVGGTQKLNTWNTLREIPATTPQSEALSKDLKRRDFKFVGSTICYAFMQAVGMVNDHTVDCFRYNTL